MNKRSLAVLGLILTASAAMATTRAVAAVPQQGPSGLGAGAAADSLRTNLWLVEALMGEIVQEAAGVLPPPPARVLLTGAKPAGDQPAELLRVVSARVLGEIGYEVLVEAPTDTGVATPLYKAELTSTRVALAYPDVGRTLGLWRRWVERDVEVVVTAQISDGASGRLLLAERLARRYGDRVTNEELPQVGSRLYPFTYAEIGESGWQRRLEEFAVLGTLAGLVAVYFANTGD